jgi:hypothetical protein
VAGGSQQEPVISKQEEMEIRKVLDRFVDATENPLPLWIALFDTIRHGCSGDPARIAANCICHLCCRHHCSA